jgi:hypothetical protein
MRYSWCLVSPATVYNSQISFCMSAKDESCFTNIRGRDKIENAGGIIEPELQIQPNLSDHVFW